MIFIDNKKFFSEFLLWPLRNFENEILILSLPCVLQCTNYDNNDLRILFTLESHRSTRFGVFSTHHLQEQLIVVTSVVILVHNLAGCFIMVVKVGR